MSQSQPIQLVDVSAMTIEDGVQKLVAEAVGLPASDLLYVTNEQHVAVQVRYLGQVRPLAVLPLDLGKRHLQHIKARAGLEVTEKRRPLDGRWIYEQGELRVDLRINSVPTLYGEDFAIRLLDREKSLFPMESLGMTPEQLTQYSSIIQSPGGLVLITGPTGSGKTATLYSTLGTLNDGQRKINTIEDPVEFAVAGLRQSQVNPHIGLTFVELLRGVLRQSADVIMIGEIRDAETAQIAVHAANSGILVLATLHAPSAAGAVQSLRALGVNPHFLSTSLRCVVSQRLIRTLCPKCRVAFDLSEAALAFDDVRQWLRPNEGRMLYASRGCDACRHIGYSGLSGVFEVMPISREMRSMIAEGRGTRELRERAAEEKVLHFRQAAMLKVARGETSTEEVFRVIPAEQLQLDE